jgi:superfamily II DNA or RNA helicase
MTTSVPKSSIAFRAYQDKASAAIRDGWTQGLLTQLLVLPTGTGKTIVFAREIGWEVSNGHKVLVLAHREELLEQARDKLKAVNGLAAELEKAESHASLESEVVVASVQTLCRTARLQQWPADHFDLIIIDEAHRTLAESYQKVLRYFTKRKLGVTATPDRGDKKNLGTFYQRVAYEYSLIDAVRENHLARPTVKTIPLRIDLDNVEVRTGDFADDQVGSLITPLLPQISRQLWEEAKDRKLIVFMPTVETCQQMAEAMKAAGWSADWVAGISEDRKQKLEWYEKAGAGTAICNAMLLTEGYDCPSIDAVCVLRATKVRALYAQAVGRGTRLFPGKKNLLILDFLWHSTRHLLIKPAHLIAKNEEIAAKMIEKGDGDLIEAMEGVEQDVLRALEKRLRDVARRKSQLIDPLDLGTLLDDLDTADYSATSDWENQPVTEYQKRRLEKGGINLDLVTCYGHAQHIIEKMDERMQLGLGTLKQVRQLKRFGYKDAARYTFKHCGALIGRIAANNWKPFNVQPFRQTVDRPAA